MKYEYHTFIYKIDYQKLQRYKYNYQRLKNNNKLLTKKQQLYVIFVPFIFYKK